MPMNRKVMATALRGTKVKGKVNTSGICALLGLKPFTPHDLRRTVATLAGDLGFDDAWIAKCLDHAASKKQEQIAPSVTGKVYNHSKRMKESAPCSTASQPNYGGLSASRPPRLKLKAAHVWQPEATMTWLGSQKVAAHC